MAEKAQSCNLSFEDVTLKPDPMSAMHESYRGFYVPILPLQRDIKTIATTGL